MAAYMATQICDGKKSYVVAYLWRKISSQVTGLSPAPKVWVEWTSGASVTIEIRHRWLVVNLWRSIHDKKKSIMGGHLWRISGLLWRIESIMYQLHFCSGCMLLFIMFHLFLDVCCILIWILHMFSHICCNSMFQNVSSVLVFCCSKCLNVASCKCVYLDVAYIFIHITYDAIVLSWCCVCLQWFQVFFRYFCKCFRRIFQMFHLFSAVCCNCRIWIFQN